MKKIILFASILMFLSLGSAYAKDTRIGVVNTARLLKESPQADMARKKLETEFAPRDIKIVTMQNHLKKLEDDLARNTLVMSEPERQKLERDILSEKRDIKRAQEEFTEDFNIRRNDELARLQKLVYETITTVAKEKSFDIILGESVLYASDGVDITEQVLERLKQLSLKTSSPGLPATAGK